MELKCVECANRHPDKLNEEGKRDLGIDIMEEMPIAKLDKFLKMWGYHRK